MPCQPLTTWWPLVRPPYIPGMELAGVVDAVGAGTSWRTGDRVMAIVNPRRPGGERSQQGDGVGSPRLRHPDRIEAKSLGTLRHRERIVERQPALVGKDEPKLHGGILREAVPVEDELNGLGPHPFG